MKLPLSKRGRHECRPYNDIVRSTQTAAGPWSMNGGRHECRPTCQTKVAVVYFLLSAFLLSMRLGRYAA